MSGAIDVAFRGTIGGFVLDAAFDTPVIGVTGLFGPSGCGKTTLLRCMAGLNHLDGRCVVDGDVWQDDVAFRPPHRRPVGYVFQEASLFPHLSVRRNLVYGAPREEGAIRFDDVVALLGLAPLLDRSPERLSGGERQRVAIGRALLSQPKLLLMDEPLAGLDRGAKEEILPFLETLHAQLALPAIYVSHDMAEIERLADHLVLMRAGRIVAGGSLADLQSDPALPLAAERDAAVTFDATVEAYDAGYGLATLSAAGVRFSVPMASAAQGERRRLTIRAGDISLALEAPRMTSVLNILPAWIASAKATSPHEIVAVLGLGPRQDGLRLLARVTRRSWDQLALEEGMDVYAQVKGVALARRPA